MGPTLAVSTMSRKSISVPVWGRGRGRGRGRGVVRNGRLVVNKQTKIKNNKKKKKNDEKGYFFQAGKCAALSSFRVRKMRGLNQ